MELKERVGEDISSVPLGIRIGWKSVSEIKCPIIEVPLLTVEFDMGKFALCRWLRLIALPQ